MVRSAQLSRRLHGLGLFMIVGLSVYPSVAWCYEIGHTTLSFVDPSRGNRPIPTEVYYPANISGEDVPIAAPPAEGFPVVSFGHGFVISVDDYTFLWQGLTPEGYILALPRTETGLTPSHSDLALDLAFVCVGLQAAGEDPLSPFYGTIAATSAVGGHSMGGGASFLALAADPNISALFNFAAAETNPSAIAAAAQVDAPALLFSGSLDCVTPPDQHQLPMYHALASDCRTYVELQGASHCQFAEYNLLCSLGEAGCPSPTISRTEQHALTLAFLEPWLARFLRMDLQAWIDFQALLTSHPGILYLQDCEASAVTEQTSRIPQLHLRTGSIGSGAIAFALEMPWEDNVRLQIHDPLGRCITTLLDGHRAAGLHPVSWIPATSQSNGIYLVKWVVGDQDSGTRFLLVR